MGRAYTDAEMLLATQIAYLDVTPDPNATLDQILAGLVRQYAGRDNLSKYEQKQWDVVQHIRHMMEEYGLEDAGQWKIRSFDRHEASGMYGCLIDTADGNAIIGFRGSESYNTEQTIKDWGIADLGLLNNEGETAQQREAERYMREIAEKYADDYGTIGVTGHSLGGNLATHATLTAPDSVSGKLECTSFDGPGFSDEYLKKHREDIEKNADKITHYRWSFVGGLLFQPDGCTDVTIRANNPEGSIDPFVRHDTSSVVLDENGNVIPGPAEAVSEIMSVTSKIAEIGDGDLRMTLIPIVAVINCLLVSVVRDKIQDFAENFRRNLRDMFGSGVRGEYEVEPSALVRGAGQYSEKGRKLDEIAEEVGQIERNLLYDSFSGTYIKSKLWALKNSIHNDADKTRKMEDALYKVQELYYDTDVRVEDRFYGK